MADKPQPRQSNNENARTLALLFGGVLLDAYIALLLTPGKIILATLVGTISVILVWIGMRFRR